jgi:hypothetical protein
MKIKLLEESKSKHAQAKKERNEKKKMLQEMKEHPELDVEVNIIMKETGFIETHHVFAKDNKFKYKDDTYVLDPKGLVLEPTKDSFKPFYVFKEGEKKPWDFSNKNKRIPSRVLTLLYNLDTYRILIVYESKNINLILVIIGLITLGVLAVYGWLNFGHGQLPKLPFIG